MASIKDSGSYTIPQWCELHEITRQTFYNLEKRGEAPKSFHVGRSRRISVDADLAWTRKLEARAA
jgi:predicted DNA-binding transcriptional regulator AlpA